MTSTSTFLTIGIVTATSIGAVAFKQYTISRDVLWLIGGLTAYNTSNIAWIMLIDQTGLARAMVYSAAVQIVLMTLFSALLGEAVGRWGWLAALLASVAVIVASFTAPDHSQSNRQMQPAKAERSPGKGS